MDGYGIILQLSTNELLQGLLDFSWCLLDAAMGMGILFFSAVTISLQKKWNSFCSGSDVYICLLNWIHTRT
ncbi:hypothetical protein OkiPb00031_09770 [Escherichia coli]